MLRRLYTETVTLAGHRHAVWLLFVVSVAEGFVFPVPVEAMLVPMMFAAPKRSWLFGIVATSGTVVGGVIGYYIGLLFFETVGMGIIRELGIDGDFDSFVNLYDELGFWIVFVGGFTPIPYKVVAIASGFVQFNVLAFVVISVLSRGLRYGFVAALFYWFGPSIRAFVERHLAFVTVGTATILIVGFAALRWVF